MHVLFIDPLIQELRSHRGIRLAGDTFLRSLLFADDIVLLAQDLEDLNAMLRTCEAWGEGYGMRFNAEKSKLMQLAGRIPARRPEVTLEGQGMTWVDTFSYLGMPIWEGRSRKVPTPTAKIHAIMNRFQKALSPKSHLPLHQVLSAFSIQMQNTVLYPAGVMDMDWSGIDQKLVQALRRATGCRAPVSSTFLRCELGFLPCKYVGHQKAMRLLWRLQRSSWFREHQST